MDQIVELRIHGDNIVECERTLNWLAAALSDTTPHSKYDPLAPATPRYIIPRNGGSIACTLFPGFGRWPKDILSLTQADERSLREAPDALVTKVVDKGEEPLVAFEFCAALAAGNQSWQRLGRAYSFSRSNIPYLYVTEMGGEELDGERQAIASRQPNPAIPLSFLMHDCQTSATTLPVFEMSPVASGPLRTRYSPIVGTNDLLSYLEAVISETDTQPAVSRLRKRTSQYLRLLSEDRKRRDAVSHEQWTNIEGCIANGTSSAQCLLEHAPFRWNKRITIPISPEITTLLKWMQDESVGAAAESLPLCIIPAHKRGELVKVLQRIFPKIGAAFTTWIDNRERPLGVCWINGFKPGGDDARPDRGVPALGRMLYGDDTDMLSVVFGPALQDHINQLDTQPQQLMRQNGLWEVTLALSDAVLVHASRAESQRLSAHIASHWRTDQRSQPPRKLLVPQRPRNIGEQDVDTALHMALSIETPETIQEGLCNPPGGDWSGLSTWSDDGETEFRWLSLPRVSGPATKRPDHVFQLHQSSTSVLLAIESKSNKGALLKENDIGARLTKYVKDLIDRPPSAQRQTSDGTWEPASNTSERTEVRILSAVACLESQTLDPEYLLERTGADLVMALDASSDTQWHIHITPRQDDPETSRLAHWLVAQQALPCKYRLTINRAP